MKSPPRCLHSSPLNFKWLVWTFLINKCFFLLNEKQMAFLQNDSPCHFRCWAWQKDWEFLINKWLFSRMSSHMMLQMLSLRNELWTFLTNNFFSPEWLLIWFLRCPATENDIEHSLQTNCFSPQWVLIWFFRCPDSENDFEHSLKTWFIDKAEPTKIYDLYRWK